MKLEIEYLTNIGLNRLNNEDSILIGNNIISSISMDNSEKIVSVDNPFLCAVADGMGGHNKGEIASYFVLNDLRQNIHNITDISSLKENLLKIKENLDSYVSNNIEYTNMGTVIAGVLILDNEFIVFNVGDCRVYENNYGYTQQLTKDHSFVFNLYEIGELTYDEINSHPKKHIVTSAFIGNKNSELDNIFIKKFVFSSFLKELIICSDGIWETLNITDFDECFKSNSPINFLKQKTIEGGANDNFSGIYIKVINE